MMNNTIDKLNTLNINELNTDWRFIIFHDNGNGTYGFTEYSQLELDVLYGGSIEKLAACYEEQNILIYEIGLIRDNV